MSTRTKGNEFQARLAAWFALQGWTVHNFPPGGRWQKRRDVFGCDLIAKRREGPLTLWIQATADKDVNLKRKLERIDPVPWGPHDVVIIAIRRKPKRVALLTWAAKGQLKQAGQILEGLYTPPEDEDASLAQVIETGHGWWTAPEIAALIEKYRLPALIEKYPARLRKKKGKTEAADDQA